MIWPIDTDLVARWPRHGAHPRTLRAGWRAQPTPFGQTPGFTAVICTFLVRRLRALPATKPGRAWRHPQVAIGWNLPRRPRHQGAVHALTPPGRRWLFAAGDRGEVGETGSSSDPEAQSVQVDDD